MALLATLVTRTLQPITSAANSANIHKRDWIGAEHSPLWHVGRSQSLCWTRLPCLIFRRIQEQMVFQWSRIQPIQDHTDTLIQTDGLDYQKWPQKHILPSEKKRDGQLLPKNATANNNFHRWSIQSCQHVVLRIWATRNWKKNNAHQKWRQKKTPVRKEARWTISSERVDCQWQFESLKKTVLSTCFLKNFEQIWVWIVLMNHLTAFPPQWARVYCGRVYCGCWPGPTRVMTHRGRMVSHQCANLVLCVVASACVVVLLCGRHVRGETCYSPTHDWAHVSWGSDDLNGTPVTSHPLDRHSRTPSVHFHTAAAASSHHVHINVGPPEPCSRENFTFLGHAHWAMYLQHQLVVFVDITRVTVHLVDTIFVSTRTKPTIINVSAHSSLLTIDIWKSKMKSQLYPPGENNYTINSRKRQIMYVIGSVEHWFVDGPFLFCFLFRCIKHMRPHIWPYIVWARDCLFSCKSPPGLCVPIKWPFV